MKKRFALVLAAAAAMGSIGMLAAQADAPVGGVTNSSGCGLHLEDHGNGMPAGFYKGSGTTDDPYVACTIDDAHP